MAAIFTAFYNNAHKIKTFFKLYRITATVTNHRTARTFNVEIGGVVFEVGQCEKNSNQQPEF